MPNCCVHELLCALSITFLFIDLARYILISLGNMVFKILMGIRFSLLPVSTLFFSIAVILAISFF